MKVKDDSVNLHGLEREMQPVLKAVDRIWKQFGQEAVCTSARDGTHGPASWHYFGLAADFRTRYFDEETKRKAIGMLRSALSDDYDVINHATHCHVEYDPK
jgi:hypothetical protein